MLPPDENGGWTAVMDPPGPDIEEARVRARRWAAELLEDRLRPPPILSVSEWADEHRILPDTSAEPGRWRTSRTPYLREFMDSFSDPLIERVVFMKPAQIGGSEALLNVLGYFIDQDPAPVLFVQISDLEAQKFSKERISPMIRQCPRLAEKVAPPKSRDSDNTIEAKGFPGGHLGIVGATAPSKLRARPRRVALCDEVDGYPASAGVEGDPVELAVKRTSTFWNRKIGMISTPTLSGLSRIEDAFEESDQRRYFVPCPHCGERQTLDWPNLKWDKEEGGDGNEVHLPDTAAYLCEKCGALIEERHKGRMLQQGEWVAQNPDSAIAGFHINAIYSPWVTWPELVREWLAAQGHPEKLKVFVNTRLAEPWDEQGQQLSADPLLARREEYTSEPLPEKVALITAGVDVQADRLEVELVGWGPGEESWSLDYLRIPGDPSVPTVWNDLDDVIRRRFEHPFGVQLPVAATAVDSGFMTQEVYKFCSERQNARVWAVKGMDGMGRPIMGRPRRNTRGKVPLYPVGVDAAKVALYQRLQIEEEGNGYCHFPQRDPYDKEYFRQLTSEKLIRKTTRTGYQKLQWVRRPNRRAEALDVRVYAMAALEGLQAAGIDLGRLQEELKGQAERSDEDDAGPDAPEPDWATGGGRWGTW